MPATTDCTTLVCLFHHYDQARAALTDIQQVKVPESSITVISANQAHNSGTSSLELLGVPDRDLHHLETGIRDGGTIIAVAVSAPYVDAVERIFSKHKASKIDEAIAPGTETGAAIDGETAIPIVEEELQVGRRTVDQGGVRVYRRIVEVPAEESVNLREEHVVVERNVVDRPASEDDLGAAGNRVIELTETAEQAVVTKNAHVVEEVLIGKQISQHTEHISDTVRKTEVEVEELLPNDPRQPSTRSV
jgi:uncharacterized protein (TIGR02271 family)